MFEGCCITRLRMNFILIAIYILMGSAQAEPVILDFTNIDISVTKKVPDVFLSQIFICPPSLLDVRETFITEIQESIDHF